MDRCFVEGSSDSWSQATKKVVFILRAEVLRPDNGWAPDVVDYKCGEVIDVVNGRNRGPLTR